VHEQCSPKDSLLAFATKLTAPPSTLQLLLYNIIATATTHNNKAHSCMHTLLPKGPELQNDILQQQQQQQGPPPSDFLYKWNKKLKAVCVLMLLKNQTTKTDFFF
jgi:hypothetical protein